MKVLEEGKWQNPWTTETVCKQTQCCAKLLIEEADVAAPDFSNAFTYSCPVCGTVNYLEAKEIPLRVRMKAEKGRKAPSYSGWRD